MTQIDQPSAFQRKIRPEFGFTPYKIPGCTSYRVSEDSIHRQMLVLVERGTAKLRETRFMRKLSPIPCLNCLHLKDRTCPYSEAEIKDAAAKFRKTPILCRHCGAPFVNFHYFLLKGVENATSYTCESCQLAEASGILAQHLQIQKKKARSNKAVEITSVIFLGLLGTLKILADFLGDSENFEIVLFIMAGALFIDFILFIGFALRDLREVLREKRKNKQKEIQP